MDELMSEPANRYVVPLRNDQLSHLPDPVARPTYDRSRLTPGILHIGLGNFHRGHQAWYLHRLMQTGLAHDWAIVGAGVREFDELQRRKMATQDYLTTLIELDPSGQSIEVIGSMIDYVPIAKGNGPLIERMSQPDIRIVSTTVTEGGYYQEPNTRGFDASHPHMVHDAENPDAPMTLFGAMVAALRKRRDTGIGPFTGMCCDNIQGNGNVLRQTVVSLARQSDPDLADWIDANCSFPNSMVDCIVPATGDKERALVRELGIGDDVPVTHESFRQWVLEDDFCAGRPDWHKVGVTFTERVHDYEAMKIRILNASHSMIAEAGQTLGIETIADCMADADIGAFMKMIASTEIAATLAPVPEFTPLEYVDLIVKRFSNPLIFDTTRRVAADSGSKHPGFIIPMIREQLQARRSVSGLALAEAIWANYCTGKREDGSTIAPNDPNWEALQKAAVRAQSEPQDWLGQSHLYGELASDVQFSKHFGEWAAKLKQLGVRGAIQQYLRQ